MVRGSNESRSGARFSALVQNVPGVYPASYSMDMGSFPGVNRPGLGVNHSLHIAPRLKKCWNYISSSPCIFMADYRVNITYTIDYNFVAEKL
jgi:hypothetical protein